MILTGSGEIGSVTSRPATFDDLPLMVRMEELSFGPERFSRKMIARYLRNPNGSIVTEIIEYRGQPAGYAVFFTRRGGRTVSVQSICILPELRNRGIAGGFLKQVLSGFRAGFSSVVLRVRASNGSALGLYGSLGFGVTGRQLGYYPDGEDALIMTLTL